jgi:hypothetical protein
VPAIFALLLGILAYRWARRDLGETKVGRMHPALKARATAPERDIAGAVGIARFAAVLLLPVLFPWAW